MVKVTVEKNGEVVSVTEGKRVVLTLTGVDEEGSAVMQMFGDDTSLNHAITEHALIVGQTIAEVFASNPPEGMAILLDSMDALITGGKKAGDGVDVLAKKLRRQTGTERNKHGQR